MSLVVATGPGIDVIVLNWKEQIESNIVWLKNILIRMNIEEFGWINLACSALAKNCNTDQMKSSLRPLCLESKISPKFESLVDQNVPPIDMKFICIMRGGLCKNWVAQERNFPLFNGFLTRWKIVRCKKMGLQSVVYSSGQKMALRTFHFIITQTTRLKD